jgi:hypothetical protein
MNFVACARSSGNVFSQDLLKTKLSENFRKKFLKCDNIMRTRPFGRTSKDIQNRDGCKTTSNCCHQFGDIIQDLEDVMITHGVKKEKSLPAAIQENIRLEDHRFFLLKSNVLEQVVAARTEKECAACIAACLPEVMYVKINLLNLPCQAAPALANLPGQAAPALAISLAPAMLPPQPTHEVVVDDDSTISSKRTMGDLYSLFQNRENIERIQSTCTRSNQTKLIDRAHEYIGAKYRRLGNSLTFVDVNTRQELIRVSKQLKNDANLGGRRGVTVVNVALIFSGYNLLSNSDSVPNPYLL